MDELLDIFNDQFELIGKAHRNQVHKDGLWHQTFHCWILSSHDGNNYVLAQKRSRTKLSEPDKLDISAAGHLLSGETKLDGLREVHEELGLTADASKVIDLGVRISVSGIPGINCNREFCNVFFLIDNTPLFDHDLQDQEVSGLVEIKVDDGLKLFGGDLEAINATLLHQDKNGKRIETISVKATDFIQRLDSYYLKVFIMADRYFKGEKYLTI